MAPTSWRHAKLAPGAGNHAAGAGLVGGWPGAILGQQCFRHKTQKQPFRTWFFISVALNVAALAGLYVVYTHLLSR